MDLYTLTLPLDTSAGATLRGWLVTILEAHPVANASTQEIVLAATEAFNNAVRHKSPDNAVVVVTISIVGRDVYLRVTDRDRNALLLAEDDARPESEPSVADSLGLALMHGLMDEVDLHRTDDGTTVRLVKRLHPPLEERAAEAPRGTATGMQTSQTV